MGVQIWSKTEENSLTSVKTYCFPLLLSFLLISYIFVWFHVVSLNLWSDTSLSKEEMEGGCSSTWTPCALYVWKISIFGLLNGLDLLNISWSFVTMCAYHVSSGKFHGDLVITCLWKYLKCSTWCFIMSTYMICCGYYVTFHRRLHLNLSWLKDYISFQSISNHYLSS